MARTPWALIDEMLQQGLLPDPDVLRQILAHGEEAVEPLLEVLRIALDEGDLIDGNAAFAARLLGALGAAKAAPLLVRYLREGHESELEGAAEGLGFLGDQAAERAQPLADDPALPTPRRAAAERALAIAVGGDEALPNANTWLDVHAAEVERVGRTTAAGLLDENSLRAIGSSLRPGPQPPPPAARPGRNEPCWCGSGKKYKACHWVEDHRSGW